MGIEIGFSEAKTKLPELLRSVRRGKPVADLIPTEAAEKSDPAAAVEAMRAMRKIKGIKGNEIGAWIAEGRR